MTTTYAAPNNYDDSRLRYDGSSFNPITYNAAVGASSSKATLGAWLNGNLPNATSWQCVVYGNGLFVAGSLAGPLATSPDGLTWTSRTNPTGQCQAIAYGNGVYVAMAQGALVATSPDAAAWSSQSFPIASSATGIAYGNGLFVAVSSTGLCATSPNGITWTSRTIPNGSYQSIYYGNGLFIASSTTSNLIITSPDGITWTSVTNYTTYGSYINYVTYGNGVYVGVVSSSSNNDPTVYTSLDGSTWTPRKVLGGGFQGITYGNGLFVALYTGKSLTSNDGITWTTLALPNILLWISIAYNGGTFVVLKSTGAGNALAYVTNVVAAGTTYRYLFADVLTGAIIGELSMTGVAFDQKLNTPGTLNAHILLSGIDTAKLNVAPSTIPMRCAIYVDRNGTIIWGGVIWARSYDSKTQILTITAREWLSYFEKRKITNTSVFTAIDQLAVAQQLVANAQSATYGNINCLYNADPLSTATSGVAVTQTYYSYELKQVFSEIQTLSQQSGGFDYAIDCYYDGGGNIAKSFNTYYPRRGIAYSSTLASVPVFELAGNIVEYTYPEDGSLAANTVYVQGAGSNEGKLIATSSDATKYAAGWPLIEDSSSFSNITDPVVLGNLASGKLKAIAYPPTTLKVIAPPYLDPMFGTYRVGDDVRVRITDPFFPAGSDAIYRIVALSVVAGEKSPEQVTLTLAQAGTSI